VPSLPFFAILAAGMEKFEPAEHYMRDLLLADRSADDDMRMALSYVTFFQKVGRLRRSGS
jgi:hypothetical protein